MKTLNKIKERLRDLKINKFIVIIFIIFAILFLIFGFEEISILFSSIALMFKDSK